MTNKRKYVLLHSTHPDRAFITFAFYYSLSQLFVSMFSYLPHDFLCYNLGVQFNDAVNPPKGVL